MFEGYCLRQANSRETTMSTVNPYAPPASAAPQSVGKDATPLKPGGVIVPLLRWSLICILSAGPSFYVGLMLGQSAERVAGMIVGILLFIIAYTYADIAFLHRKTRESRRLRLALRIGYGIRMGLIVLPPAAAVIDIPAGLLSVGLVNVLPVVGSAIEAGRGEPSSVGAAFLATLLATIIQGVLLNVVLGVFTLGVYALIPRDK